MMSYALQTIFGIGVISLASTACIKVNEMWLDSILKVMEHAPAAAQIANSGGM